MIGLWYTFALQFLFVPGTLEIPYISPAMWDGLFRVTAVSVFSLPMFAVSALVILLWQYDFHVSESLCKMYSHKILPGTESWPILSLFARIRPRSESDDPLSPTIAIIPH
jgi:hypothetical protein